VPAQANEFNTTVIFVLKWRFYPMKIKQWIVSNKIVIILPLLALICVGLFAVAYDRVQGRKAIPAAAPSYPTPTIEAADQAKAENLAVAKQKRRAAPKSEIASDTSKVIFQVDSMSCSGCISTIKSSLAGFEGIQDIIVDISGGVAEVYYDSQKIQDVNRMASSITASGYPARVSQVLTADEIRKEEAIATARSKFYIASVSGWDISRSDFKLELAYAQKRYQQAYGENVFAGERGKLLVNSIKAQVVARLINEGIQMQEVQRAGYRVDPKIVDREFENFMTQKELDLEGLRTSLEKNGYPFDYFMKKFENQVLLRRYLDDKVFNGAVSDADKQKQYRAWYNNARVLSKVTIYDRELKRVSQNAASGGGCGQSSGGSSCCSTNKS
jgi:copper chaperone CopZ